SSASRLAHAWAGVPPHEVWISPTGTPSSFCNFTPKWYATAEKLPTVSGAHSTHLVKCFRSFWSVSGCGAVRFWTVNSRISGCLAAAFTSSGVSPAFTDHSMFDWPDAIHTSPTATLLRVTVLFPLMVRVNPVPAFWAGSLTDQLPSLSAVV